jgi:hypothetical protein
MEPRNIPLLLAFSYPAIFGLLRIPRGPTISVHVIRSVKFPNPPKRAREDFPISGLEVTLSETNGCLKTHGGPRGLLRVTRK